MNRYAELTESQRRQIDLLINSLASEPDHDPVAAMAWWIKMKRCAQITARRAAEDVRERRDMEELRRFEREQEV